MPDPALDLQTVKDFLNLQDRTIARLTEENAAKQAKLDATLDDEALDELHTLAEKCRMAMGAAPAPVAPPSPVESVPDEQVADEPAAPDEGGSLLDELDDPTGRQ